jgi:hypothetical protein
VECSDFLLTNVLKQPIVEDNHVAAQILATFSINKLEATLFPLKTYPDLMWYVVDLLVNEKSESCEYFLESILNDTEFAKDAAKKLFYYNNLKGLEYYTSLVERENAFSEDFSSGDFIMKLSSPSAVPFLIRMIRAYHRDGFKNGRYVSHLNYIAISTLFNLALNHNARGAVLDSYRQLIREDFQKFGYVEEQIEILLSLNNDESKQVF